jgi:hypothetical protein
MQIEWVQIFGAAGALGFGLGFLWIAAYFLSGLWAGVWAWIDDSKAPEANPLIANVMKRMGWIESERLWGYEKGSLRSDGECAFFYPLIGLFVAPTAAALMVWLYPLTIAGALAYFVARLARFARRHKKLFDKHLKDPEAHK